MVRVVADAIDRGDPASEGEAGAMLCGGRGEVGGGEARVVHVAAIGRVRID